ncbi:MAG: SDR family oxidoreductase [Taibaiella sp.]|nr:SDR family oxidoreductase [Taibaiella sp.]
MILVTGSTGTFGSSVAKELQKQKKSFKAAAQTIEKVTQYFGDDVQGAAFTWDDPESFDNLLKDVTVAFIISPSASTTFHNEFAALLEKAKTSGVEFIVLATVFGADANKDGAHYLAEELLKKSGIPYAIVRPNFIFQNFINYDLGAVKSGTIYLPSGDGKTSYVDVRDVASVIVEVLNNTDNHVSKTYTITGSEAIDHMTAASIFTEVLGREIKNINPSEEDYKNTLKSYNLPESTINFMAMLYSYIKAGYFAAVTSDFESLMKRQQILFKDFVEDYKDIFNG